MSCFLFSPSLCLCQGYPQALLPLTVAGIPSIHICLDFIPELLAQPQLEKQVKPPSPLFFLALNPRLALGLSQCSQQCFYKSTCDCMFPHRSLQSSCCRTCVPSTPYPSPSVWRSWPSVSWAPSSQVSEQFSLSLRLLHLCLWL